MNHIVFKKLSLYLVIVANLTSVWLGTSAILFRDAIVFSITFLNSKLRYHLYIMSGILLILYLINSDFHIPAFSKFRNFIFFPFLVFTLIQVDKYFRDLKSIYLHYNFKRVLNFVFVFVFVEVLTAVLFPDLYRLGISIIMLRLQEAGVGVGLDSGFILPTRLVTPILNPVQFSVILFTFYIFSSGIVRLIIIFIAIGLCASKSFILAILFFGISRVITNRLFFLAALFLALFMPIIINVSPQEVVHLASMELRIASLYNTIAFILTDFTTPIEKSFISLPDIEPRQIFGFESFVGSFIGVTGAMGLMVILGLILFIGINKYRVTATFLILLMYSDNTSSMYLFILPLLLIQLKNTKYLR